MRIAEVAKLFAGSCVVYVVVAACSAYSGDDPPTNGGPPRGTNDGSTNDGTILDPVGNALAEGHKSGSRLKLRFYEGSDGSRQFINFWDTELKTYCWVTNGPKTTDDKVRCLPPVLGNLIYSNDTCTTPAAYEVNKTAEQPTVAGVPVIFQNREAREFYALGPLQNPPAGTVYVKGEAGIGQGGCATRPINAGTYNYYGVGAPLAPTAFVEMTIKTE
jgi:hypothetical protein